MLDRLVQANRLLCWHSILNHRAHSNATIEVEIRELILRLDADDQEMPATETIDGVINQVSDRLARQLAMTGSSEEKGTLVINGGTSVQRVNLRNVGGEPDNGDSEPFVYATGFLGDETPASIVDLPMSGFAWLPNQASGLGSVDTRSAAKTATIAEEPLVDGLTLRNEFLQARVDEESGGLAGLFDFATRGNRLSQRLSTGPRPEAPKMVASEVQVQSSSGLYGEVQSKGVLLDDSDEEVAKFCQTFSLWRGSRTLLLRIQLEPTRMPSDKPWKDYLGCRWAWTKDDDQLYRTAHGMRFPTEGRRCEIPDYLEIENGKRRTYVLTGGLPYHTRISERTLDSLLLVRGETATEFEFGIGVDLRNPLQDATNFWLPELAVSDMNCPAQSHGWLFHIDARYVVADGWQPIWVDRQMDSMAGAEDAKHCVGFRVRLFESAGRACDATIRCPVAVDSAYKTDFFGEHLSPVIADESQHDDGAKPNNRSIRVPLGPYEWTEVEVRW
jgi:alpha-mannosidase